MHQGVIMQRVSAVLGSALFFCDCAACARRSDPAVDDSLGVWALFFGVTSKRSRVEEFWNWPVSACRPLGEPYVTAESGAPARTRFGVPRVTAAITFKMALR